MGYVIVPARCLTWHYGSGCWNNQKFLMAVSVAVYVSVPAFRCHTRFVSFPIAGKSNAILWLSIAISSLLSGDI